MPSGGDHQDDPGGKARGRAGGRGRGTRTVGTVVQPPSATIWAGTGSVRVAWAVVNWLVLVTTTV